MFYYVVSWNQTCISCPETLACVIIKVAQRNQLDSKISRFEFVGRRWLIRLPEVSQTHAAVIAKRKGNSHLPENKLSCRNSAGRRRTGTERKDGWIDEGRVRGRRSNHLCKPTRCYNPSLSVWGGETVLISIYNPLRCLFLSAWSGFDIMSLQSYQRGEMLVQFFFICLGLPFKFKATINPRELVNMITHFPNYDWQQHLLKA